MHIKNLYIILGIIAFLILLAAELIWFFVKKDETVSEMLKKIFFAFVFAVFIVLYMAAF